MNQLLLLRKNNITETMSYSNWKKEIQYYTCIQKKVLPINSTFDINSLESKMKKGSQTEIKLTRSIYGTTVYDVLESEMTIKSNNLEKRIERNVSRHSLSSNKTHDRSCIP